MKQYQDIIRQVMKEGIFTDNRTGEECLTTIGATAKWDLSTGRFPAVTTKQLFFKPMLAELLWFLRGSTDVNELREIQHGSRAEGNTIWDADFDRAVVENDYVKTLSEKEVNEERKFLGNIYGAQYRGNFKELPDQLYWALDQLKNNPDSRKILVSAWNAQDIIQERMGLEPCHFAYHLNVIKGKLHLVWFQRSVDVFLGLNFNIASYALLNLIICRLTGLEPGSITFMGSNVHIYKSHLDHCDTILERSPLPPPTIWINEKIRTLEDVEKATLDDFRLLDYKHHGALKGKMFT